MSVTREELIESHDAWMHNCKLAWADMRDVAAELDGLWAEFDVSSPLSDKVMALAELLRRNSIDPRYQPASAPMTRDESPSCITKEEERDE